MHWKCFSGLKRAKKAKGVAYIGQKDLKQPKEQCIGAMRPFLIVRVRQEVKDMHWKSFLGLKRIKKAKGHAYISQKDSNQPKEQLLGLFLT